MIIVFSPYFSIDFLSDFVELVDFASGQGRSEN
jgi:hypothetical protein